MEGTRDPLYPGRGWSWSRISARSIPTAGIATLRPSLPRHCHVPPVPADAQELEPSWPGALWHPWTPTQPRSWRSLPGCCHNPVPQFPPSCPSPSMGLSLPAQPLVPVSLIQGPLHPSPFPALLKQPAPGPSPPLPGLLGGPQPHAGLCRTPLWGSAPLGPIPAGAFPFLHPLDPRIGGGCPCVCDPSLCHPAPKESPTKVVGCQGGGVQTRGCQQSQWCHQGGQGAV